MLNRSKLKCRRAARRPIANRYTALMGILIGMDEAGYGPHLGPLVIAATAWQVPDELSDGEVAFPGVSLSTPATMNPRRRKTNKRHASTDGGTAVAELNPKSAIRNPQSTATDLYRLLRNVVCKKSSDRRIAIA